MRESRSILIFFSVDILIIYDKISLNWTLTLQIACGFYCFIIQIKQNTAKSNISSLICHTNELIQSLFLETKG
jgi:hypothetical protein